jgi:uncharacterized protein (DUF58 family)
MHKMRRVWSPTTGFMYSVLALGLIIFANVFSRHYFQLGINLAILHWLLAILLSLGVLDYFASRQTPPIQVTRELTHNLAVDKWTQVKLQIRHDFTRVMRVKIFDGIPGDANYQHLPLTMDLLPGQISKSEYWLRPLVRGSLKVVQTHVEFQSPFKFWTIRYWVGEMSEAKVYPDFVAIANYAILATENHTSQMGIKKKPRRGEGMEFHQLREYRQGDSLRQVDWKATSRRQKLIAREYQDERDQQIVLMIDSGRRMRAKDDDLSHFDHALNAMLLVSYIALKQGDNVSLLSFGSGMRWIPPQKGIERVKVLLNGIYDLHASQSTADYIKAAEKLSVLQTKRSLIVLVTNSRDEDNSELMIAVNLLKKRHLVMVANIREKILDEIIEEPVNTFDEALTYAGAKRFILERHESHNRLVSSGVYAIDCTANQLAVSVANAYWEIKGAGVL